MLGLCGVTGQAAGPEPAGWYCGDIHVHRDCGSSPTNIAGLYSVMVSQDMAVLSLLADMGNGEVQDATTDLPLVNGKDASVSTAGRLLHWDAEWHWDADYTQYPHQALGGHIVALGLTNAYQIWSEPTYPIFEWAHQQGGIGGFAHFEYLDDSFPTNLTCCTPIDYPVEVALGDCDFISEDVGGSDTFIHAYYRLLNCGFRPGFAAGSDWPCGLQSGGANPGIGPLLTYSQVAGGQLTYSNWIHAIALGRTMVTRNGRNEFVSLVVNGTNTPGDEIELSAAGSVPVTVTWTAQTSVTGILELVCNGVGVASQQATVGPGSPVTLSTVVNFPASGWLCARRMDPNLGHQAHTAAVFVTVNGAPVRASAVDAQFYVQWMENMLTNIAPGGIWNSFFPTTLATVQARYQTALSMYQQIVTEAGGVPAPLGVPIGNSNEGAFTDSLWGNAAWINAGRFQAVSNAAVSTVYAQVGAIAGHYKCAIYADAGGSPSAFLCGTAEVSNPADGWQAFPLTSSFTVTNGTYYWLAIWSDDANAGIYYSDNSGTLRWGQYNYGTWPNPITTTGGGNLDYCIYATGSAGPAPTLTSIAVTPASPTLVTGTSQQFTATGTYSDGSTANISSQATWSSSLTSVATIATGGLATAVSAGSTTISASLTGVTGSTTLTVQTGPLGVVTTSLSNGTVNITYSATLIANGGTLPYAWAIASGSLPGGLALNMATGAIAGTPTNAGTFTFTARVSDSGSPQQVASNVLSITISPAPTSVTIWPSTAVPGTVDGGPDSAVELGVKFRSDLNGNITGIRFYKAAANTGTHVGNLWSTNGTLLGSITFSNETASGWQQMLLAAPVAITSNTVYVASYHANSGHYSADANYFASEGVDSPPLHALADGVSGGNGVYAYGTSSTFPAQTYNAANYWVDVAFEPAAVGVSGAVAYYPTNYPASGLSGKVVSGVTMTVTGDANLSGVTLGDGSYALGGMAYGGTYCVTPSKADDSPTNRAVTSADAALIQRYVVGLTPLDSPYKLLAADVNANGVVNTADATMIQRMVVGLLNTFPAGTWRFVPANYVFLDPQNPWNAPSNAWYTNLVADVSDGDFIAIRLGDLNNSWTAPASGSSQARRVKVPAKGAEGSEARVTGGVPEVVFGVNQQSGQPRQTVVVGVTVSGFRQVTSAQFSLAWDPAVLRYVGTGSYGLRGMSAGSFGSTWTGSGKLAFGWYDPEAVGVTLGDGTVLFGVSFEVIGRAGSVSPVTVAGAPTVQEVGVDFGLAGFGAQDGSVSVVGPGVVVNQPGYAKSVFRLSVPTEAGRSYSLEYSDTLAPAQWTELPAVVGDGTVTVMVDPAPTNQQRFYRVHVK